MLFELFYSCLFLDKSNIDDSQKHGESHLPSLLGQETPIPFLLMGVSVPLRSGGTGGKYQTG